MKLHEHRTIYSSHRTLLSAQNALEDYYATGEVCQAERPDIEFKYGSYCVTTGQLTNDLGEYVA
jgi:hypothetical protein